MTTWHDLPAEIRLMVLKTLASSPSPRKQHLLSGYATVCREWQHVFEETNFSSIKVHMYELTKFDNIFQGSLTRRRFLRHLHLRIRLPKYNNGWRVPEDEKEQYLNNVVFTHSICDLFEILARWDTDQTGELEVELEVYSPSDLKELYGKAGLDRDGFSRFFDSFLLPDFSKKPDMLGSYGFPEVEAVTGLRILRRTRRNIDPRALYQILRSLPRLVQFRFEPWHQQDQRTQDDLDRDYAPTIPLWPTTLKRVSIFEHSDAFDRHLTDAASYVKCPQLGRNLARQSLHFEKLFVSNFADARSFFEPYLIRQPEAKLPVWTHLKQIALTSAIIKPDGDAEAINNLLQAAGHAARRMPLLEVMEIYNASRTSAGAFAYVRTEDTSIVIWKSTWAFEMETRVRTTWTTTTDKLTGRHLAFVQEPVLLSYDGPVSFIQSMVTADSLLHPISQRDLR
ncbi:hypothetical protein DL767_008422 [Monosporascus sp. MG133]|nr:hypothetical protein DL767_008422 [Monosporascus sp. MG133]